MDDRYPGLKGLKRTLVPTQVSSSQCLKQRAVKDLYTKQSSLSVDLVLCQMYTKRFFVLK